MANRVLFVVEGKSEKNTICGLFERILKGLGVDVVIYCYETTVYDLYRLISKRENKYLSLLSVLWERNKKKFPKDIIKPNDAFSGR